MRATLSISQEEKIAAHRILYDPVSWIYQQRFPLPNGFTSPRCRHVLNDILLTHFSLGTGPLDFENDVERYLIRHWHLLPHAAFMATCQRFRSSLFRYGLWWKLDNATRQFALLTLSPCSTEIRCAITIEQMRGLAEREISCFAANVSDAMKARLPLLFPEQDDTLCTSLPVLAHNTLLMRMAIQHAERNPYPEHADSTGRCPA